MTKEQRQQPISDKGAMFNECNAIGGYCSIQYSHVCKGRMWEGKPLPKPLIMPVSLLAIFAIVGGILAAFKYL